MKILIIDDSPARYRSLVPVLKQMGVTEADIQFSTDCMSARKQLTDMRYDLMIVDFIIPLRAQDEPSAQHSRDLLEEIVEEDDLIKPTKILGLTADKDAANDFANYFEQNTWRIIEFSENSNGWASQIRNCVEYLQAASSKKDIPAIGTDVAILCALKSPELRAVLRLPWEWTEIRPLSDSLFVHQGRFSSGGKNFSVTAAHCTRMGIVSSALTTAHLIEMCRPRHIVMTGICAGIQGKVQLGDAILADPSWDWQSGKIDASNDKSRFAQAPHQLPITHDIRAAVQALSTDKSFLGKVRESWQAKIDSDLQIHVGPLASGSSVLADPQVVDQIKHSHRELIGVDMEVYGLYAAAQIASRPRPIPFAIKSVCDFANPEKNDDFQSYAAYTSAKCVQELLERHYHAWAP